MQNSKIKQYLQLTMTLKKQYLLVFRKFKSIIFSLSDKGEMSLWVLEWHVKNVWTLVTDSDSTNTMNTVHDSFSFLRQLKWTCDSEIHWDTVRQSNFFSVKCKNSQLSQCYEAAIPIVFAYHKILVCSGFNVLQYSVVSTVVLQTTSCWTKLILWDTNKSTWIESQYQ